MFNAKLLFLCAYAATLSCRECQALLCWLKNILLPLLFAPFSSYCGLNSQLLSQRSSDARVHGSQGGMDESSRFLSYALSLANMPLFQ